MECLTKVDLLFYLVHDFLSESNYEMYRIHLDSCAECQKKLMMLEKDITQKIEANQQGCARVQSTLIDYIQGNLTTVDHAHIVGHLNECDYCQFIYQLVKSELTVAEVKKLKIEVPHSFHQKVNRLLKNLTASDRKQTIRKKLEEIVELITLTLSPLPAPAFLGDEIRGEALIEFICHTVQINVGERNRVVKLFSLDNVVLERQVSNDEGLVTFMDILPGMYKILVVGFKIDEVVYKK